jgi:glycosyltransferase A (GT-A) superfamily protein (DUF2064 family)
LGADHAQSVLAELARGHDAAIVPAHDGGYCLIALARDTPELFGLAPGDWGGPHVLEMTLAAARAHGLDVAVLAPEDDLDTPGDARRARTDARVPEPVRAALSEDFD